MKRCAREGKGLHAPRYFKGDGCIFSRPPHFLEVIMSYIYELFQAPRPEEEWTTEYDFDESPSAFPIAE